jgi:hypothetical protein
MKKFSWYTIIHPGWHKGEPPLFRLVGPAILPDERTCDIYFKPNRKGGYNRKDSHLFNIDGKKFWGKKKWRKAKRHFYKNVSFFEGLPKRYWRGMYLYKLGLMLLRGL